MKTRIIWTISFVSILFIFIRSNDPYLPKLVTNEITKDSTKISYKINQEDKEKLLIGLEMIREDYSFQVVTNKKFWRKFEKYSAKDHKVDSFLMHLRSHIENVYQFYYKQRKSKEIKDSMFYEVINPKWQSAITNKELKKLEEKYPGYISLYGDLGNDTIILGGKKITDISKDSIGLKRYAKRNLDQDYFNSNINHYTYHSDRKNQFTLNKSGTINFIDAYELKTKYMMGSKNQNFHFKNLIYHSMRTDGSNYKTHIVTIMAKDKSNYDLKHAVTSLELQPTEFHDLNGYIIEYDHNMKCRFVRKFKNGKMISDKEYELLKLKATQESLYNEHYYASDWYLRQIEESSDSIYVYTIVK